MNTSLISFPNDPIKFIVPSWQDLSQLTFEIAQNIQKDKKKFDRIITLAKGGWPMTRSLVDFLAVKEVASIGVKFYKGIGEKYDKPIIYQDLPVSVKSEDVLLFDDVADSGGSLIFVKDYLLNKASVNSVITATQFYKPHSKIKPDYYGQETSTWIVFPYEVRETINILKTKWEKQGLGKEEIIKRFEKLGFKFDMIEILLTVNR